MRAEHGARAETAFSSSEQLPQASSVVADSRIICLVFGPTFFSAANYIFLSKWVFGCRSDDGLS